MLFGSQPSIHLGSNAQPPRFSKCRASPFSSPSLRRVRSIVAEKAAAPDASAADGSSMVDASIPEAAACAAGETAAVGGGTFLRVHGPSCEWILDVTPPGSSSAPTACGPRGSRAGGSSSLCSRSSTFGLRGTPPERARWLNRHAWIALALNMSANAATAPLVRRQGRLRQRGAIGPPVGSPACSSTRVGALIASSGARPCSCPGRPRPRRSLWRQDLRRRRSGRRKLGQL